MAQRPAHDMLERQPWAASSRNAVIDRCNRIINGDFIADKDILPRSGPWKHRLVDPHKALRNTTGRCVCLTPHPRSLALPLPVPQCTAGASRGSASGVVLPSVSVLLPRRGESPAAPSAIESVGGRT